jgi:hypothetical protein
MPQSNRQICLASHPVGVPSEENFQLVEREVPDPQEGELLIKSHYLSVDPYLRGVIGGRSAYLGSIAEGDVIPGGAVGTVVASRSPGFAPGDVVSGYWGWQEYALSDGQRLTPFDTSLAPMSTALGILGMPGLTAYFGFLEIGQPERGEQVFVSAAAGAVGSLVCQIGKIMGCRVAGSAGSEAKIAYLTEHLGIDAAFDYTDTDNYGDALHSVCPGGIDVYFDNVGGPLTDAVFPQLNDRARVVVCGQIDQYNDVERSRGPRLLWHLIVHQARAEGFLVQQFADRFAEGRDQLVHWLQDGKITYRESVAFGIENTPKAFIGLFSGENIGKQLVKVVE